MMNRLNQIRKRPSRLRRALPLWCALLIVPALAFGQGGWFWPSPVTLLALAYITIVPMGVGNVAWFSIVGLLPAHLAGLSSILVPAVAMVSGAMVHGGPLGPLQLAAMACCGGALALALLVPARR